MSGVKVSNGVKMGKGLLAYYDSIITHDVEIGDFVELSPGCKLLGHVKIGDQVHVGAGAIILPRLQIGEGAIIGAGAVVTKDVEPHTVVVGNPAKVLKKENK
jgi:acetyltransferase-like isoleucine patch superfamily enzyme